jgi:hypothetical protein
MPPEDPEVSWNFNFALRNEIGLVSVLTLFAFFFMYLCYKLSKQFGWNNYKKMGGDLEQKGDNTIITFIQEILITIMISSL